MCVPIADVNVCSLFRLVPPLTCCRPSSSTRAVLVNKCDLVSPQEAARVEAVLRALNPHARVLRTVRCDIPLDQLLHSRRFDAAAAEAASSAQPDSWATERAAAANGVPAEGHTPESESCGISSVTCAAVRPFHPQRLWDCVMRDAAPRRLLRSKGFMWLASQPGLAWGWSTSGASTAEFQPAGQWRADAMPKELWPQEERSEEWDPVWGDRRQQLVLIGLQDAPQAVLQLLHSCLLTDEEMAAGEEGWEAAYESIHAATWDTLAGETHQHDHHT